MEWVFIWIMFGVVCAVAANSKNRGSIGWFFMGMLFGPFALLILIFLPKQPDPAATPFHDASRISDSRTCPYCAETIKMAAIVCKHCGRDIPPATPEEIHPAQEPPEDKRSGMGVTPPRCKSCGDINNEDAVKCRNCGADLNTAR